MNEVLYKLALAIALTGLAAPAALAQKTRTADYIAAVVNQELVTANEVDRRVARIREEAQRTGQRVPAPEALRRSVLDALIDERVVISHARDSGVRIDDGELDRAMANIAAQNQLSGVQQLRERLAQEGIDYTRFRAEVRDQMLIERVREREVQSRIRVNDGEIDTFLAQRQQQLGSGPAELNIAQILVPVPENASDAVVAERRARAEAALSRVRAGEPFDAVAREVSEDANRERGGALGLRPADRLPDVFLETVKPLQPGDVSPTLLRTGAGFHVLKLVERRDGGPRVTQSRVRHILLRPAPGLTAQAAVQRLAGFKRQIESGARRFEDLAREHSEDGSAAQGGDLGWANAGSFVPEFEEAVSRLSPGGLSDPVVTRFGAHLIQLLDRRQVAVDPKQLREQARTALREQKFQQAYADWVRDLRSRAYIELRDPPA